MNRIDEFRVTTAHLAGLALFMLSMTNPANAQMSDIVHLKNGDHLTVEVKELDRGQMRLKTAAFGTIYVKWEDVDRIETDKPLQIEVIGGSRYFGPAQPGAAEGNLTLDIGGELLTIPIAEVVYIQPIKGTKSLAGNLDNSLAAGFSYTKANSLMQWNVSASTEYRAERYLASASFDSMITNNGSGKDSKRRDLGAHYFRFLQDRWLWFANTRLQQNDELGIDGRLLVGGGVGRYLVETQKHRLLMGVGLTANVENALGSSDSISSDNDLGTSLEALLYGEWGFFRLHSPKSDVTISASLFPGLTESDRLRGDAKIRYRQEFIKNLFLNLTYYYNFDTAPPTGALSESDYGIVTSLELEI